MRDKYKTPADFRSGLEARLRRFAADTHDDVQSIRRRVAFDRLLSRFFAKPDPPFFLKGGYAMELRLVSARATKDIDITYLQRIQANGIESRDPLLGDLRKLASADQGDFFVYTIEPAQINLDNAPYGGARYPVSAFMAKKLFVRFHLDVGGDTLAAETEMVTTADWLNFCGIAPPVVRMISVEQQFAEKIHAYTLPRKHQNSRVKDLIDLLLLMQIRPLDPTKTSQVLHHVFRVRDTHPLPQGLPTPPLEWAMPYADLAKECGISADMDNTFGKVALAYADFMNFRDPNTG